MDLLGFVVSRDTRDALYLRGYDELTHHNLILRAGPRTRGGQARLPGPDRGRPGPGRGVLRRARLADGAGAGRRHAGRGGGGPGRGPARLHRRVLLRRRPTSSACSSATTCGAGPNPPGSTTSTSWSPTCAPPTSTTRPWASACPRRSRTSADALRRLDVPQADRARRGVHRGRGAAPAPPGVLRPRVAPGAADLRHPRLAARGIPDRARPRPARGVQRLLRVPAGPGRAPGGDLHQRLLHRRPRASRAALVGARPAAPRLLGPPGDPVLVHRGHRRARPGRPPAPAACRRSSPPRSVPPRSGWARTALPGYPGSDPLG